MANFNRNLGISFACAAALQALGGCSLASRNAHHLSVTMPQTAAGRAQARTGGVTPLAMASRISTPLNYGARSSLSEIPATFDELNCFAVFVRGPGLPGDTRFKCTDPSQNPSKLIGLVPAGGSVDFQVMGGPARTIQLVGFKSPIGCDVSLDRALNENLELGEAVELAQKTVDVFSDMTIEMKAIYDPARPVDPFPNCDVGHGGGGETAPLVAIYKGAVPTVGAPAGALRAMPFTQYMGEEIAPGVIPNLSPPVAGGAIQTLGLTEISAFQQERTDSPEATAVSAGLKSSIGAIANGLRAAIQLRFDFSKADLSQYKAARIELLLRGGAKVKDGATAIPTSCPMYGHRPHLSNSASPFFTAYAGILNGSGTSGSASNPRHWIPIGDFNQANRNWSWAGNLLSIDELKKRLVVSAGRAELVLQAESTYLSNTSYANCESYVQIAGVRVRLLSELEGEDNGQQLYLGAVAEPGPQPNPAPSLVGPNQVQSVAIPLQGKAPLQISGGKPPYTIAVVNSAGSPASGMSVSDAGLLTHAPGAAAGYGIVMVTDSATPPATSYLYLQAVSATQPLSFTLDQYGFSNSSPRAGVCSKLTASTIGLYGKPVPVTLPPSALTFSSNYNLNGDGYSFYSDNCTTPLTDAIAQALFATNGVGYLYYKPEGGPSSLLSPNIQNHNARIGMNLTLPSYSLFTETTAHVLPNTADAGLAIQGIRNQDGTGWKLVAGKNLCTKLKISVADQYRNPKTSPTAYTGINVSVANGTLYSNYNCTTSLTASTSIDISATSAGKELFYMTSSTDSSDTITVTGIIGTNRSASETINLLPNGNGPVIYKFTPYPSSNVIRGQCIQFTVQRQGSSGQAAPLPSPAIDRVKVSSNLSLSSSPTCDPDQYLWGSVEIPAGANSVTFYGKVNVVGAGFIAVEGDGAFSMLAGETIRFNATEPL